MDSVRYPLQLLCCAVLLVCSTLAWSQSSSSLYVAEVPVQDQSAASRAAAAGQALEQVLSKLSGVANLRSLPGLERYREQAQDWMQAYGYQHYSVPIEAGASFEQLRLVARFDPAQMNRILGELRLPRWSTDRPELLLWLVVEDQTERMLISREETYLNFLVEDSARQRGYAVKLPQPWSDQPPPVNIAEIWGGFSSNALAISRELGFDGVLLAAAQPQGQSWRIRWLAAGEGFEQNFRTQAGNLSAALQQGVEQAADAIAARFAIAASGQGEWQEAVDVVNLSSALDYARCLSYLESINLVKAVDVQGAQGARVRFKLTLNAAPDYLYDYIARGNTLSIIGQAVGGSARVLELLR